MNYRHSILKHWKAMKNEIQIYLHCSFFLSTGQRIFLNFFFPTENVYFYRSFGKGSIDKPSWKYLSPRLKFSHQIKGYLKLSSSKNPNFKYLSFVSFRIRRRNLLFTFFPLRRAAECFYNWQFIKNKCHISPFFFNLIDIVFLLWLLNLW